MEDKEKSISSDSLGTGGKKQPEQGGAFVSFFERPDVVLPPVSDAESAEISVREKAYQGEGLWPKNDKEDNK